ncbi:MAG: response regulator [Gemmatimonadota bacterium]
MAKVLLVEDEVESQELIGSILRSAGYEVMVVGDGRMALDHVRANHVDAVVTDLRMPVLNGLRLITELRKTGDTVPILAVSGHNRDQLMLAEDLGANAALVKPINKQELLMLLDRVIADTRTSWSGAWIHPEFGKVGDR